MRSGILAVVAVSSLLFGCAAGVGGKTWSASFVMGDAQWSTGPPTVIEPTTEKLFREVETGVYEEVEFVVGPIGGKLSEQLSQQLTGGHVGDAFVDMVNGLSDAALTVLGRTVGGN